MHCTEADTHIYRSEWSEWVSKEKRMSEGNTVIGGILRQAIQFEQEAYDFYIGAIDMVKQPHVRTALKDLAAEEVKHKVQLQDLLAGDSESLIAVRKRGQIEDLKLAEYLVAPALGENASFQDVLIVAMQREKSSHEFYSTMAELTEEESARGLFEFLAQEELMHKNKVETLYDEVVYQDF
jgi:rubrerythrin